MSRVRFESDGQINGCRVLRLESDLLRLDVLPECGGKIYRWLHKPENRDWLWQHPQIRPTVLPPGANFDDNFFGGWDEIFPSDCPCEHAGVTYPDHGEYWTQPCDWRAERTAESLTLYLRAEGNVTPTRMERWITLTAGSAAVRIRYRLSHLGQRAFEYLWKPHPALAVGPSCEIMIPATNGIIATPGCGRLATEPLPFTWPYVPGRDGNLHDFSKVPATADIPDFEMVYLTELREGWWAVFDHSTRSGFGLAFDRRLFNNVWLFQSFGGWRGLHVVILEPCNAYPYDPAEASLSGRIGRLEPGEIVQTGMTATVFTGVERAGDVRRVLNAV